MTTPFVVMIPSCGGGEDLKNTLLSLGKCELPESYRETWVIENGPKSGIDALIAGVSTHLSDLNLKYLYVERGNKSNALNECISKLKKSVFIYFTDDDIKFDPQVLMQFSRAAAKNNGGNAGVYFGGDLHVLAEGEPEPHLLPVMPQSMTGRKTDRSKVSRFFLGANWAAYSEDIISAGGFDPRFGPGSELGATGNESTMMRALDKQNVQKVFLPEALVWHRVDYTGITEMVLQNRRNKSGVERGIRLALQYQDSASFLRRLNLRTKISISRMLVPSYERRGRRCSADQGRVRFACKAAYHRGIMKGWSGSFN